MKIFFYPKFLRYLKVEAHWRVCLVIILALVVIIKIENNIVSDSIKETERLREQKELISRIPYMKQKIAVQRQAYENLMGRIRQTKEEEKRRTEEERRRLAAQGRQDEMIRNVPDLTEMVLEGVTGIDGNRSALISGQIYNERQQLGDYIITGISKDAVTLRHAVTNENETLSLFEEEELRER